MQAKKNIETSWGCIILYISKLVKFSKNMIKKISKTGSLEIAPE